MGFGAFPHVPGVAHTPLLAHASGVEPFGDEGPGVWRSLCRCLSGVFVMRWSLGLGAGTPPERRPSLSVPHAVGTSRYDLVEVASARLPSCEAAVLPLVIEKHLTSRHIL